MGDEAVVRVPAHKNGLLIGASDLAAHLDQNGDSHIYLAGPWNEHLIS